MQVAGFLPMDSKYAKILSDTLLDIPVLAIMGETDQFVPVARSQQLIDVLQKTAVVLLHSGAHMMPTCSGNCKQTILGFLENHSRGWGELDATNCTIYSLTDFHDTDELFTLYPTKWMKRSKERLPHQGTIWVREVQTLKKLQRHS